MKMILSAVLCASVLTVSAAETVLNAGFPRKNGARLPNGISRMTPHKRFRLRANTLGFPLRFRWKRMRSMN